MAIEQLIEQFEILDNWEDRYRYLIELGKQLRPLPDKMKTEENKVAGCVSQVWLVVEPVIDSRGVPVLHFSGDSDAHITRGLIFILLALMSDQSPEDILAAEPHQFFTRIGLEQNLTPQRSNGLNAMIKHIHSEAHSFLDKKRKENISSS